jgi:hypothetical protein
VIRAGDPILATMARAAAMGDPGRRGPGVANPGAGGSGREVIWADARVTSGMRRMTGRHRRPTVIAARTGTGGGRGELTAAVAVTSRRPVGTGALKPALIPC